MRFLHTKGSKNYFKNTLYAMVFSTISLSPLTYLGTLDFLGEIEYNKNQVGVCCFNKKLCFSSKQPNYLLHSRPVYRAGIFYSVIGLTFDLICLHFIWGLEAEHSLITNSIGVYPSRPHFL